MTVTTADLRLIDLPAIAAEPEAPALFRSRSAPLRRTLVDVLDATIQAHGGARAIDAGATTLTYRELADAVDAVRATLQGHGIGVGDRVGIRVASGTAEL